MKKICRCLAVILGILCIVPFTILLSGAFTGNRELADVLTGSLDGGYVHWHFIPLYPTIDSIWTVLMDTPEYYVLFWNSVSMVFLVLLGQFFVVVPATWGLARMKKNTPLFVLYLVGAILPFQIQMLPWYLIIFNLNLMDRIVGVVLPFVFSTFYLFVMYSAFRKVPESVVEAAKLDGAGSWCIYWNIALPIAKDAVIAAGVLAFFEYWNMVEQPNLFLTSKTKWPLALYLPELTGEIPGEAFALSFMSVLPALVVFVCGYQYLMKGLDLYEE